MSTSTGKSDLVTVEVRKCAETEKAWCFKAPFAGKKDVWVPKSQAEFTPGERGFGVLELPEWMALEKELI